MARNGRIAAASCRRSVVSMQSSLAPFGCFWRAPKPVHSWPEYGTANTTVGRPTLRISFRIGETPMLRWMTRMPSTSCSLDLSSATPSAR